jgi:hypothetical protein
VYDGDWFDIKWRGHREMCCDCRSIHHIDSRVRMVDGQRGLQQKAIRDSSLTYAARRRAGIKVIKMQDLESSYLAGFFDGEGSITIVYGNTAKRHLSPNHSLQVSVGNTDPSIPELLHKKYGGSLQVRKAKENCRQVHQWIIRGSQCAIPLKDMLPFMRQKSNQAKLAIEFQASKPSYNKTKLTPDEIQRREWYRVQIRKLNGRHK